MQIFPLARTIFPLMLMALLVETAMADQATVRPVSAQASVKSDAQFRWYAIPPPGAPEPAALIQTDLPDAGPRFERSGDDPARIHFEQGVAAFEKGDIPAASSRFEQFLRDYPQHDAALAARAFFAESMLLLPAEPPRRIDAIQAYRMLGREAASSGNGKRASWRVGDLYRELGWYQESEIAYQQALGRADADSYDKSRALIGLGFTLLGMRKWTDAHRTFESARKQTTDPHLLAHATIGAGHALFRQGRVGEADQSYAAAYGRWGPVFRRQPYGLIRYAKTSLSLNRTQAARRLLLQFYNLYPSRPEAPEALLELADYYHRAQQSHEGRLFYAAVAVRYPVSDAGAIARIRLIRMPATHGGEEATRDLPQALVQSLLLGLPLESMNPWHPAQWLEDMAAQYADSAIGSEALFRLGEWREEAGHREEALQVYGRVVTRTGCIDGDPWPDIAGARLVTLLQPALQAAVQAKDDLAAVSIFHRHGPRADRLYGGRPLLSSVADAHARLGFAIEAARLYQSIIRDPQSGDLLEPALIGLGISYLDQQDPQAAQRVFERYRLQFPRGFHADRALTLLLTSMAQQGNHATVVRLARRWLRNHPREESRSEVLAKMGRALVDLHRPDEALPVLEEAQQLGGLATPDAIAMYADLLSQAGHHEQAVAMYRKSLTAESNADLMAWEQVQIARNFRDARKPDQARAALKALSTGDQPLFRRVAAVLGRNLEVAPKMERKRP